MKQTTLHILYICIAMLASICVAHSKETIDRSLDNEYVATEDSVREITVTDINGRHVCALLEFGLTSHLDPTYGLTISYMEQWGGYVSFVTNYFVGDTENIYIDSKGSADIGDGQTQKAFLSGETKTPRLSIVGGITYKALPILAVYLGAGYGYRRLVCETADGKWLKSKDDTIEGLEIDCGGIVNLRSFLIKLGVNTTHFKSADIRMGLGWRF